MVSPSAARADASSGRQVLINEHRRRADRAAVVAEQNVEAVAVAVVDDGSHVDEFVVIEVAMRQS
jgi:hypothetical protein